MARNGKKKLSFFFFILLLTFLSFNFSARGGRGEGRGRLTDVDVTTTRPHQQHNTMCHFPHSWRPFLYRALSQALISTPHFTGWKDGEKGKMKKWARVGRSGKKRGTKKDLASAYTHTLAHIHIHTRGGGSRARALSASRAAKLSLHTHGVVWWCSARKPYGFSRYDTRFTKWGPET